MRSSAADHPRAAGPGEAARYWRHPAADDVELLTARFVRQRFREHTHPTYTLGVIEAGIEEYLYHGEIQRVGPGGLALVEPDTVHTGHAGVPEGWKYRVFYPSEEFVTAIAREGGLRGTPGFRASRLDNPEVAAHLCRAHLAAERGDQLAASSLLHTSIAHLLQVNARPTTHGTRSGTGPHAVVRAREILHARITDPPHLEELAAEAGAAPFALLRAFRAAYGLPPHAYLNQQRVQRARALLAEGAPPAEVALAVGFADQAHLTRHFKRHTGVGPGAYRRGVAEVPRS